MKNGILLKSAALLIAVSAHGATFSQNADNTFSKMIASGGVHFVKQPGDTRSDAQFQADCAAGIGLSSCVTPSTPNGCPDGQEWSKAGSGIAHCVGLDPVCGVGTDLIHDYLGHPQCATPVITYENQVSSCPAGWTGQLMQQRTVTARATGVMEYGAWTTVQDLCVPPPPAPPPAPPPEPTPEPTPGPGVQGLTVHKILNGRMGIHWEKWAEGASTLSDKSFRGNPLYEIIMLEAVPSEGIVQIGVEHLDYRTPTISCDEIKSITINGMTSPNMVANDCLIIEVAGKYTGVFTWWTVKFNPKLEVGKTYPFTLNK